MISSVSSALAENNAQSTLCLSMVLVPCLVVSIAVIAFSLTISSVKASTISV